MTTHSVPLDSAAPTGGSGKAPEMGISGSEDPMGVGRRSISEAQLDLVRPLAAYRVQHRSDIAKDPVAVNVHDVPSYSSSNTTLDEKRDHEEKGEIWEGFENDVLPEKQQGKLIRNLRFQIMSLYRRLFGIVFVANMACFIWYCVTDANAKDLGTVVVANLFVAILMRQEYVINAFFAVACLAPQSWPLWIRRILARVYSIGGIHSGAGVSGTVWLMLFVGRATREVIDKQRTTIPTLVLSYVILALLLVMVGFAHPKFRVAHHDAFEMIHRFAGWTAVAVVWAQFVLLTNDYKQDDESLGHALVTSAPFWLVVIFTCSIVLPWLRLRKVPVRAEILSDHCVRLYFDYVDTQPGHFTRMSLDPLFEWHSFATIAEPGTKGYSAVVSRAGDWTKKQIGNPPDKLWIRGIPCYGVVRVTPLFRRVVMVATGSGIGPIAPVVFAKRTEIQLLWTAPSARKTFGNKLVDSLLEAAPGSVIYEAAQYGGDSSHWNPGDGRFGTFFDLMKGSLSDPQLPVVFNPKDQFLGVTDDLAREAYTRFGNNNFIIHSHLNTFGHGIYPLASRLFNHSCVPNAVAKYIISPFESVQMEVVALRDIAEGEEITIPYLDPALPLHTRQEALRLNYGFTCTCPLCSWAGHLDPAPPPARGSAELAILESQLCALSLGDADRAAKLPMERDFFRRLPETLVVFLHETYLPSISEVFSKASHEGEYEQALSVGRTLLALYALLYPSNYPQIGMHALELAKTTWNAAVTNSDTARENTVEDAARLFLSFASCVLSVWGPEGDAGGPLEEIRMLEKLLSN
ncbi:uncharacterized protein FIBRA_01728 [Fibroporia radiculosa]|uniref:SET domain-containing protein n=1 Tax=Fibroporia radiculosa TaxID=599839 RepID=J4I8N2_9APHY|nr:uncharacterized protein FIBRA_01728 [Fibroporia radiculosa]CCL99706.1 predicted protein [Fibroporia radiculosa]